MRSKHQLLTGCLNVARSSNRCAPLNRYLQSFVGGFFPQDPSSVLIPNNQYLPHIYLL